ncbi:unnamed protein product, partial [Bubo scandiacus]
MYKSSCQHERGCLLAKLTLTKSSVPILAEKESRMWKEFFWRALIVSCLFRAMPKYRNEGKMRIHYLLSLQSVGNNVDLVDKYFGICSKGETRPCSEGHFCLEESVKLLPKLEDFCLKKRADKEGTGR